MSSFTDKPLKYKLIGKTKKGRKLFEILEPFEYRVGPYEDPFFVVKIEKGFKTDFASLPWPMFYFIRQDGPYAKAACVHDKLLQVINKYRKDPKHYYLTRLTVDAIFYEAMLVSGVSRWIAWPFYTAVRFWSMIRFIREKMNNVRRKTK